MLSLPNHKVHIIDTPLHILSLLTSRMLDMLSVAQAMEQQLWQAEAVAKEQGGELQAVKAREAELEQQVTALTGQHNIHQRIQHHQKVKDENNSLRGQVAACRDDVAKQSIRCSPVITAPGFWLFNYGLIMLR